MGFMNEKERKYAEIISNLVYCNPFIPERMELEKQALGSDFDDADTVWSLRADNIAKRIENVTERQNEIMLKKKVESFAQKLRQKLVDGKKATAEELELYEDIILHALYYRIEMDVLETVSEGLTEKITGKRIKFYKNFSKDWEYFCVIPGVKLPSNFTSIHIFTGIFQFARAFAFIFFNIVGSSMPIAKLRAAIWQSIFTHNFKRYLKVLYNQMGDITTLITGSSGTGKELVAKAIGFSRYIPFDPETETFIEDFKDSFFPLSLPSLSSTIIEAELFGYRKGAFTGALDDHSGWFEICRPLGAVFLDEIGELELKIQIKLLRVIQSRTFHRLGETKDRKFNGKIISATNRNLSEEMKAGRFREDLYYRLCSDILVTPTLKEQLDDSPEDLRNLILFIALQFVKSDAENLTDEVEQWIKKHLPIDYNWPGNFRELEQCVRNIMIRKEYHPEVLKMEDAKEDIIEKIKKGKLSFDELQKYYYTLVYKQTGNFKDAASILKVDYRTIKNKIDPDHLDKL